MNQRAYNVFILLMLLILGMMQFYMQPKIGIFDANLIVKAYAKSIAMNKYQEKDLLAKTADDLKSIMNNYAKKHKVLLFKKGTVWSNEILDHTSNILKMLEEEQ